jgi:prevent-host-death family protein
MGRWQLQDAKARFSEVVRSSQEGGPQEITVHGKPTAVVLSKADYDRLKGTRPSLVSFLRKSPLAGLRLEISRDRSAARDPRL